MNPRPKQRFLQPVLTVAGLLLLLFAFASMHLSGDGALANGGGIAISTDKLLYQPGDKVSFNINLDSGSQSLAGDLVISVYPASSFLSQNAFSQEPVSQSVVEPGFSISGLASAGYEAALEDLKAGPGGFPVKVSLVSDGRDLLSGTAWLAVIEPGAREPLDLVLLWTVGGPPERGPDQIFTSTNLLQRCQNGSRTPDTLTQHPEMALKFPRIKTTYAFEGSLLDQLADMSDGFQLATPDSDGNGGQKNLAGDSQEALSAAGCLQGMKGLSQSANVEVIMAPYQFASLPLLAREGWDDGSGQYRIGRDVLNENLVLSSTPRGSYVPNLDLTTDSLRYVASTGGEYAVLAGSIRESVTGRVRPSEVTFRLRDMRGERLTALFANDDASAALMGGSPDPNAFFASLANAYYSDTARLLIAASPLADPPISAADRERVYAALDAQPWIQSLTLAEAKEKYRPETEPVTLQRFIDPLEGYVTETYYQELARVHDRFEDYRVAVDTDEPELYRQARNMYTAESEYFLRPNIAPDEANRGLEYLAGVSAFVQAELSGLKVDVKTPLLQRGAGGEAVIKVVNENLYPFTLDLVLAGEGIEFPEGSGQKLRVEKGTMEITVPYRAESWSRLSVQLQSRGNPLTEDTAGVRLLTSRVWVVLIVAIMALAGGTGYYLAVIRRR